MTSLRVPFRRLPFLYSSRNYISFLRITLLSLLSFSLIPQFLGDRLPRVAALQAEPPLQECQHNGTFLFHPRGEVRPSLDELTLGAPACEGSDPSGCEVGGHACEGCDDGWVGPFCEICTSDTLCQSDDSSSNAIENGGGGGSHNNISSSRTCLQKFAYLPQSFSGKCTGEVCNAFLPVNSFRASYVPQHHEGGRTDRHGEEHGGNTEEPPRLVDVSLQFYGFSTKPVEQTAIFSLSNVSGCEAQLKPCADAGRNALPPAFQDHKNW